MHLLCSFRSAGIGRTGTYCTIDLALRKLLAGDEGGLDIRGIVALLRTQRPGMVQTKVRGWKGCGWSTSRERTSVLYHDIGVMGLCIDFSR